MVSHLLDSKAVMEIFKLFTYMLQLRLTCKRWATQTSVPSFSFYFLGEKSNICYLHLVNLKICETTQRPPRLNHNSCDPVTVILRRCSALYMPNLNHNSCDTVTLILRRCSAIDNVHCSMKSIIIKSVIMFQRRD